MKMIINFSLKRNPIFSFDNSWIVIRLPLILIILPSNKNLKSTFWTNSNEIGFIRYSFFKLNKNYLIRN